MPNLPKGRSLAEFSSLSAAEAEILRAAASGDLAKIGETRPETENAECAVRAAFLRFLALGGDDEAPVHEKGLQVQGAWITGTLDLLNAQIAGMLVLARCRFVEIPALIDVQFRGVFSLAGCAVPGLEADRLTCRSGVLLRDGFLATGKIRLLGATIGGDLDCSGGRFKNPKGQALTADGVKVGGNVVMGGGFSAQGEIRLLGATIGGNLDCTGGAFENPNGHALTADGIKVGGDVSMGGNFRARGEVRLLGATIGGNLVCRGGAFENPNGQALTADGIKVDGNVSMDDEFRAWGAIRLLGATIAGNLDCTGGSFETPERQALNADRIKVGGNVSMDDNFRAQGEVRLLGATIGGDVVCTGGHFCNRNSYAIDCQGLRVSDALIFDGVTVARGTVNLTVAHVAHLVDDLQSWPENIVLDGFVYDSFAGNAPTTAKDRLAWLDKQDPKFSGKAKNPRAFRPQPWQQLRKVLRDMGHLEDARQVAIAFEDRKRECGVIGEITALAAAGEIVTCFRQWLQSRTARGFHWLYGCLIGYGYRPARLFWSLAAVWLAGTVLFDIGGHSRVFGPTDPQIFTNAAYDSCNPEKNPRANWTRCQTFPRAYPAFYPPLYALDVLLPVGKLGQQDHWAPLDPKGARTSANKALAWATQIAVWGETLFGWIAGLLLVATVTGLAKRHDE